MKDKVVLIPAKITEATNTSWLPYPVNLGFDEKGVINVQPAVVKVLLEHLVKYIFLLLVFISFSTEYQKDSG